MWFSSRMESDTPGGKVTLAQAIETNVDGQGYGLISSAIPSMSGSNHQRSPAPDVVRQVPTSH